MPMGERLAMLWGVARYELRMQTRRRSLWVILGGLGLLTIAIALLTMTSPQAHALSAYDATVGWAIMVNLLLPVGLGILLADRLPRDREHGVDALLDGLPSSPTLRLLGKYLGATLATLLPIAALYATGLVYIVARWGDPGALATAALAFAAINVPGVLFVAAFSLACPLVMPVPVYQVLYTGYWFWGNMWPSGLLRIPSLSHTVLMPMGTVREWHLFRVDLPSDTSFHPQVLAGLASVAVLLACAAAALYAAHRYLAWQEARR